MAIEQLTAFHALKPGSQVWVLPEKSLCRWTQLLDWHLHFLIANLDKKKQKKIDDEIQKTLSSEEIALDFSFTKNYESILLDTHNFFPNKCSILLKDFVSAENWLARIMQIHESLHPESLRIFLPTACNTQQFLKISKKNFDDLSVTLVEDSL